MPDRCTASGKERSVARRAWADMDEGPCPDCGATVRYWVRQTDLSPRLKIGAHNAPVGVTPAPYKHKEADA